MKDFFFSDPDNSSESFMDQNRKLYTKNENYPEHETPEIAGSKKDDPGYEPINDPKEKTHFASTISHELRGSLSIISTSMSILEKKITDQENNGVKKQLCRIKSSVTGMSNILEDLLYIDKIEQGKFELCHGTFDLRQFLNMLVEESNFYLKPGQYINQEYTGEDFVTQDKKVLKYILRNLLSNASKYSPPQTKIELVCEVSPKEVRIAVNDEGIGIPEEEQQHLFGTFFRAKNANTIAGTGLGLNIVKHLTELMHGTISFNSKVNVGSRFTVCIPKAA